jgi:hypothetical protein
MPKHKSKRGNSMQSGQRPITLKFRFLQTYTTVVSASSQYNDVLAVAGGAFSSGRLAEMASMFSMFRWRKIRGRFLGAGTATEYGAVGFMKGGANGQDLTTIAEVSELDYYAMAYQNQRNPVTIDIPRSALRGPLDWYDVDQSASIAGGVGTLFVCTHAGGAATADTLQVLWELDLEVCGMVEPSVALARLEDWGMLRPQHSLQSQLVKHMSIACTHGLTPKVTPPRLIRVSESQQDEKGARTPISPTYSVVDESTRARRFLR